MCARVGGANTTSFLAAHFVKRNTKNCGGEKRNGESEGGQKFLVDVHSPTPFLFARPSGKVFVPAARSAAIKIRNPDFRQKKFAPVVETLFHYGVKILTKRHRQFSEFGFWAIVAAPSLRSGSAETMILYGFLPRPLCFN